MSDDLDPRPADGGDEKSLRVFTADDRLFAEFRKAAERELSANVEHVASRDALGPFVADKGLVVDLTHPDRAAVEELLLEIQRMRGPRPLVVAVAGHKRGIPLDWAILVDATASIVLVRPIDPRGLSRTLLAAFAPGRGSGRSGSDGSAYVLRGRTSAFETRHPPLFGMLADVEKAARHDVTLLIVGETGTGKTTLARIVHESSPRADEPFLHLACGSIPATLMESELFGHERGAFTGADRTKAGKFEVVGKGTLLLDEIDALSLDQQVKLLRVLETGAYEPVGSNETKTLEARLIVASNVSLETLVASERFRKDLFYRLNIMRFDLPPLRERVEDIVPLSVEFIRQVMRRCAIELVDVHPDFLRAIQAYHWPGNLRELKNCIERAVILSRDTILTTASLPAAIATAAAAARPATEAPGEEPPGRGLLNSAVAQSEQALIQESLVRHKYKRSAVAKELGISRVTLYNKMRKYGFL